MGEIEVRLGLGSYGTSWSFKGTSDQYEKCLASLLTKETQIKTTMRYYYFTPTRMSKIKISTVVVKMWRN